MYRPIQQTFCVGNAEIQISFVSGTKMSRVFFALLPLPVVGSWRPGAAHALQIPGLDMGVGVEEHSHALAAAYSSRSAVMLADIAVPFARWSTTILSVGAPHPVVYAPAPITAHQVGSAEPATSTSKTDYGQREASGPGGAFCGRTAGRAASHTAQRCCVCCSFLCWAYLLSVLRTPRQKIHQLRMSPASLLSPPCALPGVQSAKSQRA